jgi:hypothetical protein
MMMRILFALLPALLVAGCSQDYGPVYKVPLDRARQILAKTNLPPVFGNHAPSVQIQANKPSEVTWVVSMNGSEIMRYIATVKEAGEGRTRIGLVLKGERFANNLSAKNLYLVAMEERIASAMEARAMDMSKIYPALSVAVVANMGTIRKQIDSSVDEAAKASEQLGRSRPAPLKRLGD